MQDFQGKVAVITGAGRGIGKGIALKCAAEGMSVVLAGPHLDSLTATAAELRQAGAETLVVKTDVSRREEVENLHAATLSRFGKIHLLVNNAGVVGILQSVLESSYVDWEWVMGVNFMGVLYGVKTFLPTLVAQAEECHLVNVSSLNGVIPGEAGCAPYSASKQAVVGLSEALYDEVKAHPHVRVSVYLPGQVNTDIADCERNYPAGFQVPDSPEIQRSTARLRQQLRNALSPAQSAEILFAGLRAGSLYIGPRGFSAQHPWVAAGIQGRAENILKEETRDLFGD